MQLIVDFNMRESDGRIPALLAGVPGQVAPGETVVAVDGEGLEVTARVNEVSADGRYAMLETVGGTYRESDYRPAAGDLYAGH